MNDPRIPEYGRPWNQGGLFWTTGPVDKFDLWAGILYAGGNGPLVAAPWMALPLPAPEGLMPEYAGLWTRAMLRHALLWADGDLTARRRGETGWQWQVRMLYVMYLSGLVIDDDDDGWVPALPDEFTLCDDPAVETWLTGRTIRIPDPVKPMTSAIKALTDRTRDLLKDDWDDLPYYARSWAWDIPRGCAIIWTLDALARMDAGETDALAKLLPALRYRLGAGVYDAPDDSAQGLLDWATGNLDRVDAMFGLLVAIGAEPPELEDTFRRNWMKGRTNG